VTSEYARDALGHLRQIRDTGPQNLFVEWDYQVGIDAVPRAATLMSPPGPVSSVFSVDRGGRLVAEDHDREGGTSTLAADASWEQADAFAAGYLGSGSDPRFYTLDGRSNWTSLDAGGDISSPGINDLDAYVAFAGVAAGYDGAGALVSYADESYDYDLFGRLVAASRASAGRTVRYDALDRVIREEHTDSGEVSQYGYDGLGRAIRKRGAAVDVTLDNGLDEHLVTIAADGKRDYYHADRMGSVYLVTDDAGLAREWYKYSAYGEVTIFDAGFAPAPASAIGNRFGYQGHPFDPAMGLVDMRARFYRPDWGRFLSADPIGLLGGSNLYAFVGTAPLSWTDPLGLAKNGPPDAGIVDAASPDLPLCGDVAGTVPCTHELPAFDSSIGNAAAKLMNFVGDIAGSIAGRIGDEAVATRDLVGGFVGGVAADLATGVDWLTAPLTYLEEQTCGSPGCSLYTPGPPAALGGIRAGLGHVSRRLRGLGDERAQGDKQADARGASVGHELSVDGGAAGDRRLHSLRSFRSPPAAPQEGRRSCSSRRRLSEQSRLPSIPRR
jgi:RHS repeat-associated protein